VRAHALANGQQAGSGEDAESEALKLSVGRFARHRRRWLAAASTLFSPSFVKGEDDQDD